jgi:protease-4
MFKPEKAEDRAYLQDIADKAFVQFKSVVSTGRTGHKNFDPKQLDSVANGKIYTANDAKKLGLVDDIGYQQDAYEYAATKAGLTKMTVVKYHDPPSFFDALGGKSNVASPGASGGASSGVTINGININAADLHNLMTPRLLYLWRGQ